MDGTATVLSGVFAGRYTIEGVLGHGATAIVYLARDEKRGHAVAIKVLKPELAQSVGAKLFLKEIRLNQRLHHPHILPVLDSGEHEGQLYFVLPHMEGGTLKARLERERQLPLQEAVSITRSVAVALAHAHEKGLVHRDVKPANILFTAGQACLGDFGIARALERALDDTTTTTAGVVRGTPPYMSPEQASGEHELDGRSDIYSLGCVLYEMLAGVPPFVGPNPQSVIAQRFTHAPPPLRQYRPTLPRAVEAVVERALAISQADRYQKASELADDLERAARTPDGEVPTREVKPPPGRRFAKSAAVVAAFGLAATAGIVTRGWWHEGEGVIPEGDPRRVAVLYLDDLTPSALPSHVADGLTEDLIDELGAARALHVISPHGVRPFRGGAVTLDSVGRALKVGTIVTGSVARSGNTMRISVRLVDAATGQQLHSKTLEDEWSELFALQDRLANQVAFFLRQRLGDAIALREHRAATKSYAAWETAQMASEVTRRAVEGSTLRRDPQAASLFLQADSLFERASQLDPSWIHPLIKRGRVAMALGVESPRQREAWLRRAIELADSALRRDARSAEALALRGEARYRLVAARLAGDSLARAAERDLQTALALQPNLAAAWATLAQLARHDGRFADAATAARRAYEADAFFELPRTLSIAFGASLHSGDVGDARRWCDLGLERYPGDPRFAECRLIVLGWTGRTRREASDAWRLVDEIEERDALRTLAQTWVNRRVLVAAVLARAGMRDSARSVLSALERTQRADSSKRPAPLTEAYVWLLVGERERALARLADHLRAAPQTRRQVARHPWFEGLRGDARFTSLVQ